MDADGASSKGIMELSADLLFLPSSLVLLCNVKNKKVTNMSFIKSRERVDKLLLDSFHSSNVFWSSSLAIMPMMSVVHANRALVLAFTPFLIRATFVPLCFRPTSYWL